MGWSQAVDGWWEPPEGWTRDEVRARALLAVPLLAAFPVALLLLRTRVSDELSFKFLVWNLFLAALPVALAVVVEATWRAGRRVGGAVAWVAWLLLFPNAPYLMTDLIHLRERPPSPLWFDALILVSAAVAGLLAAFVSLHLVQHAVARRFGTTWGWVMALGVLGVTGFGVYLGRFGRFNSWDVLTRPRTLLYDVGTTVAEPLGNLRAVAVTVLFSSFLVVGYLTVEAIAHLGPARRGDRGDPGSR